MFIIYIKQTWQLIKENRVLSAISIIGTALAMAMIIALVFVYEVQMTNSAPEINRDRTLYIKRISYMSNSDSIRNFGFLSQLLIKERFYKLKNTEVVSAVSTWIDPIVVSTPDELKTRRVPYIATDNWFWRIYSFRFLAGAPFTKEEFESGICRVVISERLARYCFGDVNEAMGRTLNLNHKEYLVCGVVANVSSMFKISYAELWIPYTSQEWPEQTEYQQTMGSFICLILANSPSDFENIKKEARQSIGQLNVSLQEGKVDIFDQPYTHLYHVIDPIDNSSEKMKEVVIRYGITLLILLIVPAINLSGLTSSRMRRRIAEIGIRKTFGATRTDIIRQVVLENLLLTLIGGILGLLVGYGVFIIGAKWFVGDRVSFFLGRISSLDTFDAANLYLLLKTVFSPFTLLIIFMFCLFLNLLSAMIPAWIASKKTIVNALNEQK